MSKWTARLSGHDLALDGDSDDDDVYAPITYLADNSSEPSQVLETRARNRLHNEGLQSALASLDPRSRRIVEARWLVDENSGNLAPAGGRVRCLRGAHTPD
ncbi:MAG: hypothetical protein V5B44_16370 [Candidatus Accumulibacter necessarius]